MFRSALPVKPLPLLPHAPALSLSSPLLMPVFRSGPALSIPLGWMKVKPVDYSTYSAFTREAYSSGV